MAERSRVPAQSRRYSKQASPLLNQSWNCPNEAPAVNIIAPGARRVAHEDRRRAKKAKDQDR